LIASGLRKLIKPDVSRLLEAFLVMASLYLAREVLIPLCLAGLVTFLLTPLATLLETWRLPRAVSSVLVVALTTLGVSLIGWVVLGQIYNLAVELPQYQQNITQKVNTLHLQSAHRLTDTVQMLSEVGTQASASHAARNSVSSACLKPDRITRSAKATASSLGGAHLADEPVNVRVDEPSPSWTSTAIASMHPLIRPATSAFAVIIFIIFMLIARDDIRDRTVLLIGSHRIHTTTVAMTDAASRVSRYLMMQFVVNSAYGLVVGVALWAVGVPHPLLWAVTTFLLRFVPYVGILIASTGPVLLALAASPNWSTACWTAGIFLILELVAANAVEPYLYGSSTGVSALAILVASVFWTWLWGLPGLLLSTPLTVCLIVIGQHFPRLEFLGVLFGERTVLDPPQRLYQRILASDLREAGKLLDQEVKSNSREAAFDGIVIPALSLVEEARHAEQLDSERASLALQQIEEVVEEQWTGAYLEPRAGAGLVICAAVKDMADDIACHLMKQVLSESLHVESLSSDLMSADVVEAIEQANPVAICVVGIPPQAIRHIRMRCHQLRSRFAAVPIVACLLSSQRDLTDVRSRIPICDANHVVCSLEQARLYLTSLTGSPAAATREGVALPNAALIPSEHLPLDESREDIFEQIIQTLARSFEAPIALVNLESVEHDRWRAECGLPEDQRGSALSLRQSSVCKSENLAEGLIVPDIAEDLRFRDDPILLENGIRFFAGQPVSGMENEEIGSLCVFDTRPRHITPRQEECLKSLAQSVSNAVALQRV
jgi:predicted PurR-regulated permease PerM/GAF domain-containing protein